MTGEHDTARSWPALPVMLRSIAASASKIPVLSAMKYRLDLGILNTRVAGTLPPRCRTATAAVWSNPLRQSFDLPGVPIRLMLGERANSYAGKRKSK